MVIIEGNKRAFRRPLEKVKPMTRSQTDPRKSSKYDARTKDL